MIRNRLLLCFLAFVVAFGYIHADNSSEAQASTFTGEITDSICARAGSHQEAMRLSKDMGKTAAQCTIACVEHQGAKYVLYDPADKKIYYLSDQGKLKKFAGEHVSITGVLHKKEIEVRSIAPE